MDALTATCGEPTPPPSSYTSPNRTCSKHILNAQASIRAPCCKKWFDCAACHAEQEAHPLARTVEMVFLCKKCKKAFRKDMAAYEESDEYCPHCDNHYVRRVPRRRSRVRGGG